MQELDINIEEAPEQQTVILADPIYRHKDGRIVTKKQLLSEGLDDTRIQKGLDNKIITQIGDTEDPEQEFLHKDGRRLSVKKMAEEGVTPDRIATGMAKGLIIPIEKKNQILSTTGSQVGASQLESGTQPQEKLATPEITPTIPPSSSQESKKRGEFVTGDILSDPKTGEPYQIQNGEKVYAPTAKEEKIPVPPTDGESLIEKVFKYNDFRKAKKTERVSGYTPYYSGEGTYRVVPDQEKVSEANRIKEEYAKNKIDIDKFSEKLDGLDLSDLGDLSNVRYLSDLSQQNPQKFDRILARKKWSKELNTNFDLEIKDAEERGDDKYKQDLLLIKQSIGNDLKALMNIPQGTSLDSQREKVRGIASMVKNFGGDQQQKNKILKNISAEFGQLYGGASDASIEQSYQSAPEKEYLNKDAYLGYAFLKDINPAAAKQFQNLFGDNTNLNPAQRAGYDKLMYQLEQTGLSLKLNSQNEAIKDFEQKEKEGKLTPEEAIKYQGFISDYNKTLSQINYLDEKYPENDQEKALRAAQEVLGKYEGIGGQASFFGQNVIKGFASIPEAFIDVYSAAAGDKNRLHQLAILGDTDLLVRGTKESAIQTENLVIDPELQTKIDSIKNNNNLSYEQKETETYNLLRNNTNKFDYIPINKGKVNLSPTTIFNSVSDLASTLIPFFAVEAATGGIGGAGTSGRLFRTFNAAFVTGFNQEYEAAVKSGAENPLRNALASTAINAAAMTGAGTFESIKAVYKNNPVVSKILQGMSEAEYKAVLSKGPSNAIAKLANRVKAIPKDVAAGYKSGGIFEGSMQLGEGVKRGFGLTEGEYDPEEALKHSIVNTIAFGKVHGITGQFGYKSPSKLQKSSIFEVAKDPNSFMYEADKMLKSGGLSQSQYETVKKNIEEASKAYQKLGFVNDKNEELSVDEKAELLSLKLQETDLNQQLQKELPDKVKKELGNKILDIQDKINDIYNGNYVEPKTVQTEVVVGGKIEKGDNVTNQKGEIGKVIEVNDKGGVIVENNEGRFLWKAKDIYKEEGKPSEAAKTEPQEGDQVYRVDYRDENGNPATKYFRSAEEGKEFYDSTPGEKKGYYDKFPRGGKIEEVTPTGAEAVPTVTGEAEGQKVEGAVPTGGEPVGAGTTEAAPTVLSPKAQELKRRLAPTETEPATEPSQPSTPAKVYSLRTVNEIDSTPYSGAAKEVVRGIGNMVKAVSRLSKALTGKEFSLEIHDTPESYKAAVLEGGGTEADADTKGFYWGKNNKAVLNMSGVTKDTGAHELFHPVLDFIANKNPDIINKLADQLSNLKGGKEFIERNKENYSDKSETVQKKEAIVDYIANVASGEIKLDRTTFEQVRDFIINALNTVGINISKKIDTVQDLQELAKQITRQFKSGQELRGTKAKGEKISEAEQQFQTEKLFTAEAKTIEKLLNKYGKNIPKRRWTISDVAKVISDYVDQRKVFKKPIKELSDKEFIDGIKKETLKELKAWKETVGDKYVSFYKTDIIDRLNPNLQKFAEKRYGRKLNPEEISLYHLVSAFASPEATPDFDSSKGLEVFDKFMKTGVLSGLSDKQATIWALDNKGQKVDTGELKYDESGNPIFSKWSKAYADYSLDKFKKVIDHFNGDLKKAVDWMTSIHSYKEISDVMGIPIKGEKSLQEHENLTKENGGFGIFGFTGAKLGSYALNRIGEYSTITKDMWYARTMARLAGESLFDEKGNAIKKPWSLTKEDVRKRKLADRAWEAVAKKEGLDPSDIQERMWDYEKRLWEKLGAVESSSYASDGFKKQAKVFEPDISFPIAQPDPTKIEGESGLSLSRKEKPKIEENDTDIVSASVNVAPLYSTKVTTVGQAKQLHESEFYKKFKEENEKLAESLGLTIEDQYDGVGGFDGLSEATTYITLRGNFEDIVKFSALRGALSPEVQESTIAGTYVKNGDSKHNANKVEIEIDNEEFAMKAARDAGFEDAGYTLVDGEISFFDIFEYHDDNFDKKIDTFAKKYKEYGGKITREETHAVRSEYIDASRRKDIITEIKREGVQQFKGRAGILDVLENAEKRNESFLKWKEVKDSDALKEYRNLRAKQIELGEKGETLDAKDSDRIKALEKVLVEPLASIISTDKEKYEQAKNEIEAIADDVASLVNGGFVSKFGIKRPSRAAIKVVRWYDSQPNLLGDGARTNVIVNTEADADFLHNEIKRRYATDLDRREGTTTELGYPKRLTEIKTPSGKISEIQIMTPQGYLAKDGVKYFPEDAKSKAQKSLDEVRENLGWDIPDGVGHYFYEINRDLNVPKQLRDQAAAVSNKYYEAFLNPESKLTDSEFRADVQNFKDNVDKADKSNWDEGNDGKSPEELNKYLKSEGGQTKQKGVEEEQQFSRGKTKSELEKFIAEERAKGTSDQEIRDVLTELSQDPTTGIDASKIDEIMGKPAQAAPEPTTTTPGKKTVVVTTTEHPYLYEGTSEKRVRGLMKNIMDAKNVGKRTKEGFEKNGIRYNVASNAEARQVAKDVISSFGKKDAIYIAKQPDLLHPSVRSAIIAESIDNAYRASKKAKTKEERVQAAIEWKDLVDYYAKSGTESGQFSAYYGHFYKTSPLGFVMRENEKTQNRFEQWYNSRESDFNALWDSLKETEGAKLKIQEEAEKIRKSERVEERKKNLKSIDDFFDNMKNKDTSSYGPDTYFARNKPGAGKPAIPQNVWDAAMETMRDSIKNGDSVASAVQKGADIISKEIGDKWNSDKFKSDYEEALSRVADNNKKEPPVKDALKKRLEDLENQIKEYKEKIAKGGELGEKKESKFSDNPEVQELIRQRDELRKENEDLLKAAGLGKYSDAERVKAAERIAQKSIDKLQKKLDENELEFKKTNKPTSAQLEAYREEQKRLRKELDERRKQAKVGKYDPTKIEADKAKRTQDRIDELNRRINESDFSAEQYTPKPEKTDLEKERDRVQKLYDEAKKQSPEYIEKKAKEYIEQLKKRLKGISDEKKKEIIRRSIKKIIDSGGLKEDELKDVVADVMGFKKLTDEQAAEIEKLTEKVNAVDDIQDTMVENPTPENIRAYEKARKEGLEAAMKITGMVHNEADIAATFKSLISGSLLGVPTLIMNIGQNIASQPFLRFPVALTRYLGENAIYAISRMISNFSGSKLFMPTTDLINAQKGFYKMGKKGLNVGLFNFMKGTQMRDYLSESTYRSTLSPRRAAENIKLWKAGEKFLTKPEVIDNYIRKSIFSRQADFILRGMGLGDMPFRWAAEGAKAMQIAVKELGLVDENQIQAFMLSPEKFAFKILSEKGESKDVAAKKAEEIKNRVIEAGRKAVFEEDNLITMLNEYIETGLKTKSGDEAAMKLAKPIASVFKTLNYPFIKIPSNIAWKYIKLMNPALSLGWSIGQVAMSEKYRREGEVGKQKELLELSKDSAATAIAGMAISVVAGSLVSTGLVRSSNDEDNKIRETTGERTYGKQNQLNYGKMIGGSDYWIDLKWFGPMGSMINTKAKMQEAKMQRELKGDSTDQNQFLETLGFSTESSLNGLVFDQGARVIDAIKKGDASLSAYGMNMLNIGQNILTGATYAAISKAMLPYEVRLKADTFAKEFANNAKAKNGLLRLAAGYPPARISIWGEPIKKDNTFMGVVGNILGFEKGSQDKFGFILEKEFRETGDARFFPAPEDNKITVDDKSVEITQAEKDDLDRFIGKYRKILVSSFVYDQGIIPGEKEGVKYSDKKYSELTKDEKIEALKHLYKQAQDAGMSEFVNKYPKYAPAELDPEKKIEQKQKEIDNKFFKMDTKMLIESLDTIPQK